MVFQALTLHQKISSCCLRRSQAIYNMKPRLLVPKLPMFGKTAGRSTGLTPSHEARVAPY
jgi:hypothetical protein